MLPITVGAILLASGFAQALPHYNEARSKSKGLKWGTCTKEFYPDVDDLKPIQALIDCAYLEVPLDYTNSDSETIQLQLARKKGSKSSKKGSVLFNPGGPGGSGVQFIPSAWAQFDEVLGGHFDLVSWDPRGVGQTIPFICTPENATTTLSRRSNITVHLPYRDMYQEVVDTWDSSQKKAEECYKANKKTGKFITTSFVARDMLEIVDALDEDGLVRYWGISYGTALGQTFAAMFPDRIDRMLLDSTIIASDYHSGHFITSSKDTNRALANAFKACIDAGQEYCPLPDEIKSNSTPEVLMALFADVLQELLDDSSNIKSAVRYSNLKDTVFQGLYNLANLPTLLSVIQLAVLREWESFDALFEVEETEASKEAARNNLRATEAFLGIACGDSHFRADAPEDVYNLVKAQAEEGEYPDAALYSAGLSCAHWKFDPAEQFDGMIRDVNTSYPLMFVNGPNDPVTPLSNAYETSLGFKGSRVLVQHGYGHAVIGHRSNCTYDAIRSYFVDGKLPKTGTECTSDENPLILALANS